MGASRLVINNFKESRHAVRRALQVLAVVTGLLVVSALCVAQSAPTPDALQQGEGLVAGGDAATNVGGITDSPILPGQVVHVLVFHAPDFSLTTRVSEKGEIEIPLLGIVHIGGLNSEGASTEIASLLKKQGLMMNPHVMVTVNSSGTEVTILGDVRTPGMYPLQAKHQLSDMLAIAGGLTAHAGRVIEISNSSNPGKKEEIPWDPTMHNTRNYDLDIHPGDRILVRGCGFAYVGGNVHRPGAYALCGSPHITLSQVIAMAGGVSPLSAEKHTYLIHTEQNGSRVAEEVNVHKVLTARIADPIVREDDIIYVSPSVLKAAAMRTLGIGLALAGPVLYVTHP